LTADERNYLFQKVKKAGKLQRRKRPGMPDEEQATLPKEKIISVEKENEFLDKVEEFEKAEDAKTDMKDVEEGFEIQEDMLEVEQDLQKDALMAVDVVYPPPVTGTFKDAENAQKAYIDMDYTEQKDDDDHTKDDIKMEVVYIAPRFSFNAHLVQEEPNTTAPEVSRAIRVNGSGAKRRYNKKKIDEKKLATQRIARKDENLRKVLIKSQENKRKFLAQRRGDIPEIMEVEEEEEL